MKTWKKVLIFIVLGIVGLYACLVVYRVIEDKMWDSEIEDSLSLAKKELKNNNFKVVDSILDDVRYISYRVENGEKIVEDLRAGIESGKFRVEVDKLKKAIKEKDYSLAESLQSRLVNKSVLSETLAEEDKKYLRTTYSQLSEAKDNEMKPYLEKANEGLENMFIEKDEFNKVTWYKDKTSPKYVDANAFYLSFGQQKGEHGTTFLPLALSVQFYGKGWVFHDEFQLLIDGKTHSFKPKEVERDNGKGGYVWEWSNQFIKNYISELYTSRILVDVINSKETKIRFIGRKYYREQTITEKQKKALKNVILAYVSKGGYFKFIDEVAK